MQTADADRDKKYIKKLEQDLDKCQKELCNKNIELDRKIEISYNDEGMVKIAEVTENEIRKVLFKDYMSHDVDCRARELSTIIENLGMKVRVMPIKEVHISKNFIIYLQTKQKFLYVLLFPFTLPWIISTTKYDRFVAIICNIAILTPLWLLL